jgi:hypothetical protein
VDRRSIVQTIRAAIVQTIAFRLSVFQFGFVFLGLCLSDGCCRSVMTAWPLRSKQVQGSLCIGESRGEGTLTSLSLVCADAPCFWAEGMHHFEWVRPKPYICIAGCDNDGQAKVLMNGEAGIGQGLEGVLLQSRLEHEAV